MRILLALVTASTLHFVLPEGVRVSAEYNASMNNSQATEAGIAIAKEIWANFCDPANPSPCNVGEYYNIDISVGPRYCIATIEGRLAHRHDIKSRYGEFQNYRCYFIGNDTEYHVRVDNPDEPLRAPRRTN